MRVQVYSNLDLSLSLSTPTLKVGPQDGVICPGCDNYVKCCVADNFDLTSSVVLFEPIMECAKLDLLVIAEGILKSPNLQNPYVQTPVQ